MLRLSEFRRITDYKTEKVQSAKIRNLFKMNL